MDLLLDTGKLKITEDGDLVLITETSQHVAQRLTIRLNTHVNTWFLNLDLGINYLNEIFGVAKTKTSIDALIQQEILKDEMVSRITYFNSSISNGVYGCSFRAKCTDNTTTENIALTTTGTGFFVSS